MKAGIIIHIFGHLVSSIHQYEPTLIIPFNEGGLIVAVGNS